MGSTLENTLSFNSYRLICSGHFVVIAETHVLYSARALIELFKISFASINRVIGNSKIANYDLAEYNKILILS